MGSRLDGAAPAGATDWHLKRKQVLACFPSTFSSLCSYFSFTLLSCVVLPISQMDGRTRLNEAGRLALELLAAVEGPNHELTVPQLGRDWARSLLALALP